MNIDQMLTTHERETDKLLAEIRQFRQSRRTSCDALVYDGFDAQIRMLENLGLRLYAVEELQSELKKLSAEIFPQ
jgi:hypothetical protein